MNALPPRRRAPALRLDKRTGFYYADFYDPTRTPVRKWIALGVKNKRVATQQLGVLTKLYQDGQLDPWTGQATPRAVAIPFMEAVTRFLARQMADGAMRPKTALAREHFFQRFAATLPAEATPADVTPAHVEAFTNRPHLPTSKRVRSTGRPQPLADGSRATYIAQLSALFKWCEAHAYADTNPARDVKRPRARRTIAFLSPAELDALVRAIEAHGDSRRSRTDTAALADVVRFAVYTGLRIGEIGALRWKDVDPSRAFVRVVNYAGRDTKTGDERPVPLVAPARTIIARLDATRTSERTDAPVFLNQYGGPLSTAATSRRFTKFRRASGLPEGATFHSLRRTCATVLASAGVPLRIVQKILGHARVDLTASVYADVLDRDVTREMERAFEAYQAGQERDLHPA